MSVGVALVSGASSGIGREFCNVLAARGWNLILVARREERLRIAKQELEERYSIDVQLLCADLLLAADRARVVAAVEGVDVRFVVNNAGLQSRGGFENNSSAAADRLVTVNVAALTQLSHAAISRFRKLGGPCHLLNIGSVNSFIASGDAAVYSGTKAFAKFFTLALSEELRGTPISCTCFCPGGTESEMLATTGMQVKPAAKKFLMSAERAAREGIDAALAGRRIAVPGLTNRLSVLLSRLLGDRLATRIATALLKRTMERI